MTSSPFHFPLCSIFKMYLLDHEFPFYLLNLPLVSIWKLKIESLAALFGGEEAQRSRLLIAASRTPCFSHRVSLIHQVTVCQKANNFRENELLFKQTRRQMYLKLPNEEARYA